MHFRVQMLPQHRPKRIHQTLHLAQPQLLLPRLALSQVLLELLQTRMDLLVVREQLQLLPERRLFPRKDGEDVLLLLRQRKGTS